MGYSEELGNMAAQIDEMTTAIDTLKLKSESTPCEDHSPQLRCKAKNLYDEQVSTEESTGKDLGLHQLEEELELLKEAVRMVQDSEHCTSFYIDQINEKIEARRLSLLELTKQRNDFKKPLEEKRWNLLESFFQKNHDGQLKLQKLKEIEMEMHSVLSETRKREEECVKLAGDLEMQPKNSSRGSYIQRITEITKNSRKLDADIHRILRETRELKLESNSIEERLHRTYTVVDETVFRESKKNSVGCQAYELLTSVHESFEEIHEKILATDKVQREVAELESKLSIIASRSLDRNKLKADLDALRMENELLEKNLQNQRGKSISFVI